MQIVQKEGHDCTEESVADVLQLLIVLGAVGPLEVERAAVALVLARVGQGRPSEDRVGDGGQRRQREDRDFRQRHGGEGVMDTALLGHGDGTRTETPVGE